MNTPSLSTLAFIGAVGAIGLFVFKLLPLDKALMIGGGLAVVGFVTQPSS